MNPHPIKKEEKVHKVNKAPVNFRGLAAVRKRLQEKRGRATKVPGVKHLPDVLPGQESFPGY